MKRAPVNLDRVEIAGPRTAQAEEIKPRSSAEADLPNSSGYVCSDHRPEAHGHQCCSKKDAGRGIGPKLGSGRQRGRAPTAKLHPEIPK